MKSIVQTLGLSRSLNSLILARNNQIGSFKFPSSQQIFVNAKHLDLSDCGLDVDFCTGLAQALAPTDLALKVNANAKLGDEGVATLIGLSLVELHVSKCNIGDQGAQSIVDHRPAERNSGLRVLDLSHNKLTPASIQYLASKLQQGSCLFPQLEDLNFAGNKLDEVSSQALAAALGDLSTARSTPISKLDMTDTSCGIGGAVDLVRFAQLNVLNLFNNRLGSDGFVALSKVFQGGHPTMETLDVGGNKATEAGVVALLQSFTVKSESFENTLRVVVVGGNETGPTVETVVKEITKVYPEMDVARDKPRKQESDQMNQFPPNVLQS
jgi:hypothetical protein